MIGANHTVDRTENLLASTLNQARCNNDTHIVNARGEMLKGNFVLLENLENLASEADLGVHHILFDRDDREALLARNSRDHAVGIVIGGLCHDHRTLCRRLVGVTDIDRNACVAHGEDRILVEHGRAHIGQLTKLTVSDRLNSAGVLDNSGVCHHKARNVGPVLVKVCLCGTRHDRTRNIRAATREGLDRSVGHYAVKSGNDSVLVLHQLFCKHAVGLLLVKASVLLEEDDVLGVDEGIAEVLGENETVEIFSARRRKIASRTVHHCVLDVFKLAADIEIHSEVGDNAVIARLDLLIELVDIFVVTNLLVARIQHIGHLGVVFRTLSGCRGNNVSARGVCLDDRSNLFEMLCIGKRAAAEFYYFYLHRGCPAFLGRVCSFNALLYKILSELSTDFSDFFIFLRDNASPVW